jgi:2-polyprenyl-6-methoxyphenol hydroxylase-like FAD-dependent oxidoreductase
MVTLIFVQPQEYAVIIAGGGPVGLFLAAELRRYDLDVAVVERATRTDRQIKAGSVGSASAELFDQRGLLDRFPQPDLATFAASLPDGVPVGHFAGLWLLRGAPELRTMPLFAQQYEVESVLEDHATTAGAHLLRGRGLTGLQDDGDGVRVTLDDGTLLTARFLVGCDGGRSTVRKAAGFRFDGTGPTITGRQALVRIGETNPLPRGWNRTETGMCVFGPGANRVLTVEFDGPPADRSTPLTREEIEASLRRVSGTDVTVTELITGTRWTDNTRQATSYRRGNVLLAGDAAHVHPPFGGQGLNLGFQDAANLGWKLAAAVAGWAPEGLLDSYDTERRPVAAAALDNTRAQVALMRPDPQTTALRDLFAHLLSYDAPNVHVSRLMTGVDRPYPTASAHPEAGRMATDRPVGDRRLHELLRAPGGVLLDATPDRAATALAAGRPGPLTVVPAGESLLVRPDGVVAWGATGRPSDLPELDDALNVWFGTSAKGEG